MSCIRHYKQEINGRRICQKYQPGSGTMPVQPPEIKTTDAEPSETEIQGIEIPETESRTAEFIYELPIDPFEELTVK